MRHKGIKTIVAGVMLMMGVSAQEILHAQFADYGVRASLGLATISDDLSTKSPILGAGLGGYVNFEFASSENIISEVFYLQTGLYLNRRGSNFEITLEKGNSLRIREGYYHAYYAQLPILACFQMELPIRKAGHIVGVCLGPAVSCGLFGWYKDRMVSPGLADPAANYDTDRDGTADDKAVFNHLRRFDVSAILGVTYQYRKLGVSLYVDHGFIATSTETDVLRQLDQTFNGTTDTQVEIPNGNNTAWMIAVSYQLGTFRK